MAITGPDRGAVWPPDAADPGADARGLRQLVADAPHPAFLLDPSGRIVQTNAAAAALLGHPLERLPGSAIEDLIAPESRAGNRARREAFAAAPVIGPIGVVRGASALARDGRRIPVEIGLSGIETSGGPLLCATLRDISADLLRERQDGALRLLAGAGAQLPVDGLLHATVREAATLLEAESALAARFDDGDVVVAGVHGACGMAVGDRIAPDADAPLAAVARTGARAAGEDGLAVPIEVNGRLWGGLMVAGARTAGDAGAAALTRFAEVAGAMIGGAQSRAVERALRDSEERFRLVADFIPQLLWSADGEGVCDFLNRRWTEYTGVPAEELMGHGWLDLVHPDDVPVVMGAMTAAAGGAHDFGAEFRLRRHDGVWRRFDGRGVAMRDARGRAVRWFGSNTDVEDARAAAQAVRESEAQLNAALEAGRMGAWALDVETGEMTFDANARALVGVPAGTPDPQVRALIRDRADPDDRARLFSALGRLRAGEADMMEEELRWSPGDGAGRWLHARARVARGPDGEPRTVTGVLLDVTDVRRAGARMLRSQKLEALGTLAGGIAHDFNNLLQVVGGNVALARAGLVPGHPSDEHLATAERATRRAAELVERILAFSRPEEDAAREPVALDALVADALELLRPTLPAMVELRQEAEPGLPPVLGDRVAIAQIVTNLVTNAAQAIGRRPGRVDLRLERADLRAEDARSAPELTPGPHVALTVGDDGPGIDPETLARVFDPFFTTKDPGSGTGLGLSIVDSLMRAHGGTVTAYSEPGRGTAFRLWFPAAPGVAAPEEPARPAHARAPAPARGGRVLFVDDEADLVALHETSLARAGHAVSGWTDPRAALDAFRADPAAFDVVVTDLSMPGMTGLELAREVLALRPGLPVLIASGYIPAEERAEAEAIGVREVLPKPSPLARVREAVAAALED